MDAKDKRKIADRIPPTAPMPRDIQNEHPFVLFHRTLGYGYGGIDLDLIEYSNGQPYLFVEHLHLHKTGRITDADLLEIKPLEHYKKDIYGFLSRMTGVPTLIVYTDNPSLGEYINGEPMRLAARWLGSDQVCFIEGKEEYKQMLETVRERVTERVEYNGGQVPPEHGEAAHNATSRRSQPTPADD